MEDEWRKALPARGTATRRGETVSQVSCGTDDCDELFSGSGQASPVPAIPIHSYWKCIFFFLPFITCMLVARAEI